LQVLEHVDVAAGACCQAADWITRASTLAKASGPPRLPQANQPRLQKITSRLTALSAQGWAWVQATKALTSRQPSTAGSIWWRLSCGVQTVSATLAAAAPEEAMSAAGTPARAATPPHSSTRPAPMLRPLIRGAGQWLGRKSGGKRGVMCV